MACKGCGGGKIVGRCCLCGRNISASATPWGKTRKICSHCKKKQIALIQERLNMNKRTETLMQGKNYVVKSEKVKGLVK